MLRFIVEGVEIRWQDIRGFRTLNVEVYPWDNLLEAIIILSFRTLNVEVYHTTCIIVYCCCHVSVH